MKFVFDLDGTLTKKETLPLIAEKFGLQDCLSELTSKTVKGDVPFLESFIQRVDILSNINPNEISDLLAEVPVNSHLLQFIVDNAENCIIATGNYQGWVAKLCERFKCSYRCSEGVWQNDRLKLTKIFLKDDLIRELKGQGEFVVFIGDGNNDAEAMRLADIGIACGVVHKPANSLLQICDFAIYDEKTLGRFLRQIKCAQDGQTVVVSCAGIGSRLGLGKTKALLKIGDTPLLAYIIDYFSEIEDLRIVVGFQAGEVIDLALSLRKQIIFAFNHDYFHTKTGASLALGARYSLQYVLAWDGDFLAKSSDVKRIIDSATEFLCCTKPTSFDPVFIITDDTGTQATGFSRETGSLEWSGPAKISREKISYHDGNTYELLEPLLPLPVFEISGTDIDTYDDYLSVPKLLQGWNYTNKSADVFYRKLANRIKTPLETRNKAPDFSKFDIDLVRAYGNGANTKLLELGAGTGLMTNHLSAYFLEIVAVEKYKEFARFINDNRNVSVLIEDLLDLKPFGQFDVCTLFGVMNFFNEAEANQIYRLAYESLRPKGVLLVKHNMGLVDDVYIDKIPQDLGTYYFSAYRWLGKEKRLISDIGFIINDVIDIYPREFNRYSDTHYYAVVCQKA